MCFIGYRGLTFIWNGQKAVDNFRKHRIRFETAAEIFFDPASADEDASVEEEQRLAILGRTLADDLLYVVHVEREGEWIRIILAREAETRERTIYEVGC